MVHCVSSSEPDSGDTQIISEDWRVHGIATKEVMIGPPGHHGKAYVESTVTTGIQVGTHIDQGSTHHLTKTDTHQPADTTHPENTLSRERMDTSSPNHSIYSDIMDHSPSAELQPDASRDMTNTLFSEAVNSSRVIDQNHYPILYHNHSFIPGANMYKQQTLVPDHAHYTMVPSDSNVYSHRVASRGYEEDADADPRDFGEGLDSCVPAAHPSEKFVQPQASAVPYFQQSLVNHKIMNVSGSATPGLYPHLYNYRSDINDVALANYYQNKQAYVDPYICNQFAYANQGDDDCEDSDSSEED